MPTLQLAFSLSQKNYFYPEAKLCDSPLRRGRDLLPNKYFRVFRALFASFISTEAKYNHSHLSKQAKSVKY